jgi:acetamidase/formamidase
MELVEVAFLLHPNLHITYPRAHTPAGLVTFGFHENLDDATLIALHGMLTWIEELLGVDRKEALALASLLVDLHITQIVNGVRGVHAILPHEVLDGIRE